MTLSRISSHYAGMLKAHSPSPEQAFAWEAMMTMANTIENMGKEIADLRERLAKTEAKANEAHAQTARIGCD